MNKRSAKIQPATNEDLWTAFDRYITDLLVQEHHHHLRDVRPHSRQRLSLALDNRSQPLLQRPRHQLRFRHEN